MSRRKHEQDWPLNGTMNKRQLVQCVDGTGCKLPGTGLLLTTRDDDGSIADPVHESEEN
jgi:hypothetical protein